MYFLITAFSRDKDGVSLCSRHFDGASVAYSEERAEVECEPSVSTTTSASAISANSSKLQRTGSTSCPSSPRLSSRKGSSPAPSTEENVSHGGSYRGKKCTRFMDQVSEIEVSHGPGGDSRSMGSGNSNSSNGDMCLDRRESGNVINTAGVHSWGGAHSPSVGSPSETGSTKKLPSSVVSSEEEGSRREGLSKRSKSTTRASSFDYPSKSLSTLKPSPSLSSTSSLSKASRHSKSSADNSVEDGVGACSCGGSASGRQCSGVRVKAESTSTLIDGGAESRRTEMGGGGRRKSDSTRWGGEESSDPQLHHLPPDCCAGSEHALSLVSGGPGSGRRGLLHRYGGAVGGVSGGGGSVGDKSSSHIHHLSHLSQPSNLWDISELQAGMLPRLQHIAGCSDMLAVVSGPEGGASCESVFLDKIGGGAPHHLHRHQRCLQHHHNGKLSSCHLMSASSSGSFSSTDDQSDFIPSTSSLTSISSRRRGLERPFDTYETLQEDDSVVKTSTEKFEDQEGDHLPATISLTSSASLSSSSLLKAQSKKKALTCISASEIQMDGLDTDSSGTLILNGEKESESRPSPKASLQGYLSGFSDDTKERKRKSPSLVVRKSMKAADAASPECVSLLEPSVSEVAGKTSSILKMKLTKQDSSTMRTSITSEVAAIVESTILPSASSYLPDVEMPITVSPVPGIALMKSFTEENNKNKSVEDLKELRGDSQNSVATNGVQASSNASSERVQPAESSDGVSAYLGDSVSQLDGAAKTHIKTPYVSSTSVNVPPVLPVEEMVQVHISHDHSDVKAVSETQCSSREQNQSEEMAVKQSRKVLNTSF